jgi:long-chain acyl-CoA synthetase
MRLTDCKVFFTTKTIGRLDNSKLLAQLAAEEDNSRKVVILRGDKVAGFERYEDILRRSTAVSSDILAQAESQVLPHMVCNLQFTSGTTGLPKAAMLTHQ